MLDFNGTTQYLNLATLPVTKVPFAMAGWFRFDTAIGTGAENAIMSLTQATSTNEFTIEIGNDVSDVAIAEVNENNVNLGFAESTTSPLVNVWNHIVGNFETATSRTVYLNGANNATQTTSSSPANVSNINIGATLSSSSAIKFFNGAIGELAIWKDIHKLIDITNLAKGMSPKLVRPNDLVFYAPLRADALNKMLTMQQPYFMVPVANPAPFGHIKITDPVLPFLRR